MNNYHQAKQSLSRSQDLRRSIDQLYPKKNTTKREQLVFASMSRATGWSKSQLMNSESIKTFKDGSLPLIHPDNHEFKTRQKAKEIHSTSVYVKSYVPAGERAEKTGQDFRNTHLEPGLYAPQTYFLERPRLQEKELGSTFRYGGRSESERLFKQLNSSQHRLIDSSPRDNAMLIEPKWKEVDKGKWVAKRDFDLTSCHFRGKRSADPWPTVQSKINIGDPYYEGFEVTGDIGRKRSKEREVSPKDFLTTINREPTGATPSIYNSTSIRNGKSSKFFKDDLSKSAKFYPNTLKHVLSSHDRVVSEYSLSPSPVDLTPVPRLMTIAASSEFLNPMQELTLLNKSKGSDEATNSSEFGETSMRRSFVTMKRLKNLKKSNRQEYIRQTIKSYFA